MGKKAKIVEGLKKNAIYGYLATFGLFTAGTGCGIADVFQKAANPGSTSTALVTAMDTFMWAGILTGTFMAVSVNLAKFKFGPEAQQEAREERLARFRGDNPHNRL